MLTKQGDWLVRLTEVNGDPKDVLSIFWAGKPNHVVLHKTDDGRRHFIAKDQKFATIQVTYPLDHKYSNPGARQSLQGVGQATAGDALHPDEGRAAHGVGAASRVDHVRQGDWQWSVWQVAKCLSVTVSLL